MVLFIGGAGFLTLRGSLSENGELGAAGGRLILLAYLMFTGGEPAPAGRRRKQLQLSQNKKLKKKKKK